MSIVDCDVLVLGGGHAGVEAAWIAAKILENKRVFLVTLPDVPLASTPCNPAVGGVGKGQVVCEIDSLGGLMGMIADKSGIQYRTLNESKGYAVQSTRVQVDKEIYSSEAFKMIATEPNISLVYDRVVRVERCDSKFKTEFASGNSLVSNTVVVTAGTFLNGLLHSGGSTNPGGRIDCQRSDSLDSLIPSIKFRPKRFKTGTPPRIDGRTIDWNKLENQDSDALTSSFHVFDDPRLRHVRQVSCKITRIEEPSLEIIRENKSKSPIFNGQISGIGPRYCPSIEDKAFRYPDRNSHHVFLEPEGLNTNSIYPNGISTSLPIEIQLEFVRKISGLENATIITPGYAVEYDVVDTSSLNHFLEHKLIEGLFFAGQVNGTSGYEEAAGQGIVAGINAALKSKGSNLLSFDRDDSYIGVMIDDLVTSSRDEPYRLFTARSENRLQLREDNAFLRMAKYRKFLDLRDEHDKKLFNLVSEYEYCCELLKEIIYRDNEFNRTLFAQKNYGPILDQISLYDLAKRAHLDPVAVVFNELTHLGLTLSYRSLKSAAITSKYAGYISRTGTFSAKYDKIKLKKLNCDLLVQNKNISFECRLRIKSVLPETFLQLQLIDGIRPATLSYVAGLIS